MRINKFLATAALSLALAGLAVPAAAVPADKGSASKDCTGADVRAVRVDRALCTEGGAVATSDRVQSGRSKSAPSSGYHLQWPALGALGAIAIAGALVAIRQPQSSP
jgi:hypothetical protein